MNYPGNDVLIDEIIESIRPVAGERILWKTALGRCLSKETPEFIQECINFGFSRHEMEAMSRCLVFAKEELFTGERYRRLQERAGEPSEVIAGIQRLLQYLVQHLRKARPSDLLSYLECAQEFIELGRENGTLPDVIDSFLKADGIQSSTAV